MTEEAEEEGTRDLPLKIDQTAKKWTAFLLAGAMSLSAMASVNADVYYQNGARTEVGPGVGLSGESSVQQGSQDAGPSLDAGDYAATGGVGLGGMTVSSEVPSGYRSIAELSAVPDPVVQTAETYTYDYMFHDMDVLSERYRGKLSYRSIGTSRDGRSIYEMVLGNRNAGTQVLFTAAIHGREYITTNLVMKLAEYLLYAAEHQYSFDGKPVSQWLSETCVHIVPMVNPDGVSISQFGAGSLRNSALKEQLEKSYAYDLSSGRTSLDFNRYCVRYKANAAGVDLNQNFNAAWASASGTATQGSYSGYKGPRAESEPETKALTELYRSADFKAVVNYHAMGQVIYWDIAQNKLREHSRDLAHNLSALTGYQMLYSGGGGGFKDYVQLSSDPSTSVTLEVGRTEAPVPWTEMETIFSQNRFVPLYTMKWAKEKGK